MKITRCDKLFNITDEFSFTPKGNIKNKTLFGSSENLAVCLDFVSHTLEVYDMISGDLRFTQQFEKQQVEDVEFKGSKALIKWNGGFEVLNLETLSVESQFTFPQKTKILKFGESVFQLREFTTENLKMSNELFQIGTTINQFTTQEQSFLMGEYLYSSKVRLKLYLFNQNLE
ncbi:MAG: hypothetical protein R2883_05060 [Caldisericia bacterium]